ncbi:MAG TPA: DsbA family oxidoreductase [Actinomycetota bacterium]|nr:DsbA family oxidoreductase [Actinomycetota bacterium]
MRVDIWSDVVCPWCYIGKRRFEAALDRFPERDRVEVVWRSFQLDPSAPPSSDEPGDYARHLAGKYGISEDRARQMMENVTQVAASEGLTFRFDLARRGNTFDAHRLLHFALEQGVQDDLKERLDHATFTAGLSVSDHASLARVAAAAGLDEGEAAEVLSSGRYADAVRADEAQARAYGITGVPFFVIDGKYGVSGAQPADVFAGVLKRAWEERSPLTIVSGPGAAPACDDDSCTV